ncbi:hypothetical protein Poli38472_007690 [Pythium oligandrum]|uniref:Peptidase S59 domain-containing protein n=1 Tax=Pythium oligandrum TaxID=41045 RepID=A0A8K1CTI9_PYTOL|nr:hypothetical protein Poli38472_007690 [Pythium oligandrum]|eukprot:TMW68018.1 hypothetical protein Poli38472_007690 [Pythium oligandrum]
MMKSVVGCLVWLSLAATVGHAAEQSTEVTAKRRLVEEFEAKIPQTAWQRARGGPRVGPPRRSLEERAEAIAETQRKLKAHNALYAAGEKSYFVSWNEMSDLSDEEYRGFLRSRGDEAHHARQLHAQYGQQENRNLPYIRVKAPTVAGHQTLKKQATTTSEDTTPLPKSFSWLEQENGKYLTPIMNQGSCGSCWAFSAISVIESRYAIENKVPVVPLSVEQVLSCSAPLDHLQSKFPDMAASSKGCEGGMPFLAFEYMSRVAPNGIACASNYPYVMATKVEETQCRSVSDDIVAVSWKNNESDYIPVDQNDDEALMRAVLTGPVSANIDSLTDGFRNYGGGIYDASDCASDGEEINHAVVVVGYGETDAGEKYWVIRNTWGTMWGEKGYMRMARGKSKAEQPHGPCNLLVYSSYPVNLFAGAAAKTAMCAVPSQTFQSLSGGALLGFDGSQWAMFFAVSITSVLIGLGWFGFSEYQLKRQAASGNMTYEQKFDKWIIPSKEQIAAMAARRQQRRQEQMDSI